MTSNSKPHFNTVRLGVLVLLLVARLSHAASPVITNADWVSMGGGNTDNIFTVLQGDVEFAINSIVCAGTNTYALCADQFVVRWDGYNLNTFIGPHNGIITLSGDSNGTLYAGGSFDTIGGVAARHIAKWNGNSWMPIGNGLDSTVNSIAFDRTGNLFAGGDFDSAGSTLAHKIAKWDGVKWTAVGSGMSTDGHVVALTFDRTGNLYAVGSFREAGGVHVVNIAEWDGSAWSAVGSATDTTSFRDATVITCDYKGIVYVGGVFASAGGVLVDGLAKWDGAAWSSVGARGDVLLPDALICDDSGSLYVGSASNVIWGNAGNGILKWNGKTWFTFGGGMQIDVGRSQGAVVAAFAFDKYGMLYVGGNFPQAGSVTANCIARWDGTKWSALRFIIDNTVNAIVTDQSRNIFIGGRFSLVGGSWANHVAKWDGGRWCTLGSGVDSGIGGPCVYSIAADDFGNFFVGGTFDTAGHSPANSIAKWDGTRWGSLGSGMDDKLRNDTVLALATDRSGILYAGGNFLSSGKDSIRFMAQWNGSAWSSLGSGVNSIVKALAVDASGNIFAGGNFTLAGDDSAKYLAKWDRSKWNAVGQGMDSAVNALVIDNAGNIYAAGDFTSAGGLTAGHVAKWDGSKWNALGAGVNGTVSALALDSSGNLYAGGEFDSAGRIAASCIARWNGSSWSALGSGLGNGSVSSLMVFDSTLYVGGTFMLAGGKTSFNIAKVNIKNGPNGVTYHTRPFVPYAIKCHIVKSTLLFSNLAPHDRISLYSLSGRCIREAEGVSRIRLSGLAPQPLIVRVKREGRIVSSGMVMGQ